MARTINASTLAELDEGTFNLSALIAIDSDGAAPNPINVYFTDAAVAVDYLIYTFQSDGHLMAISDVKETGELRVNGLKVTLSGADQAYISAFLGGDYMDARLRYWLAVLSGGYAVIGDPILVFDGNITGFDIKEDGSKSTITVDAASHWANWDVVKGNRTNDTSQQAEFPGDLGMEFAATTDKEIRWGR